MVNYPNNLFTGIKPEQYFVEGDEVSGFIDFDLSEINIRLWDVCYLQPEYCPKAAMRNMKNGQKYLPEF